MTKRDVLTKVVALEDVFTVEEREVAQKMIDGLDRKSSKPTKAQIENLKIKNEILAYLADGRKRTASQIADEVGYSTAKVSALLRACVLDGKVEKVAGAKSKDAPSYVAIEGAEPYPTAEDTPQE
jgi:predicted Rossmann fold nucleotide-binding protein DprA/Smf involved in DNA uptake